MQENYIELIDKFLHNELSIQEQQQFDELYKNNPDFKNEIELQKVISIATQDVINSEIINEIENQHIQFLKKQQIIKWWKWGLSIIGVVTLLISGYYLWKHSTSTLKTPTHIIKDTTHIVSQKNDSITINNKLIKKQIIDTITNPKPHKNSNVQSSDSIKKQIINDTLWSGKFILPSYKKINIISKNSNQHQYEFDGKVLKIYGLPQLDFDLCKLNIRQNKLYLFQPNESFVFEIKKTTQKTKIDFSTNTHLIPLFNGLKRSYTKKTIKIEQKLTNEKEVKTNFSIFVVSLRNNLKGHKIIPEKKQLLWTKEIANKFGENFKIILLSGNNQYYIQKGEKYFRLKNVKELQPVVLESDPVVLRYLTTHTENIQIQEYNLENETFQYGN